jgi:hypothetical protein
MKSNYHIKWSLITYWFKIYSLLWNFVNIDVSLEFRTVYENLGIEIYVFFNLILAFSTVSVYDVEVSV